MVVEFERRARGLSELCVREQPAWEELFETARVLTESRVGEAARAREFVARRRRCARVFGIDDWRELERARDSATVGIVIASWAAGCSIPAVFGHGGLFETVYCGIFASLLALLALIGVLDAGRALRTQRGAETAVRSARPVVPAAFSFRLICRVGDHGDLLADVSTTTPDQNQPDRCLLTATPALTVSLGDGRDSAESSGRFIQLRDELDSMTVACNAERERLLVARGLSDERLPETIARFEDRVEEVCHQRALNRALADQLNHAEQHHHHRPDRHRG